MIRVTAVICLLALLALVLYIPSAAPPERFIAQLRVEYSAAARHWGEAAAAQALQVAMTLPDSARVAKAPSVEHGLTVESAVGSEMNGVNQRLFGNAYFRAIDALLVLASFRVWLLVQALPWLAAFGVAVLVDGYFQRSVKAREFRQHNPEVFAASACLTIAIVCGALLSAVLPSMLHPLALPLAMLLATFFAGQAVASYWRRL